MATTSSVDSLHPLLKPFQLEGKGKEEVCKVVKVEFEEVEVEDKEDFKIEFLLPSSDSGEISLLCSQIEEDVQFKINYIRTYYHRSTPIKTLFVKFGKDMSTFDIIVEKMCGTKVKVL
jgi:hypothetical protein